MFDTLSNKDVLLHHPYESFDPIIRLMDEAADDPDVLAIKQMLYGTDRDSPLVEALIRAAENDKYVTAIIELKSRYREAHKMEWAKKLEQASVQVIYGVQGLRTHAKLCIVVRREPDGIQRYVHFGTGDYNETTARLFSDISLLTSDEELGADATTSSTPSPATPMRSGFRKIDAAPAGPARKLIELIQMETQRKQQGQQAVIIAKLNALGDQAVIDALYDASQEGVDIAADRVRPVLSAARCQGLSENIRVINIVDRFREHSRVFYFYHGGDEQVFISSADWMPRNLDRRVELLVPVQDPAAKRRLIANLEAYLRDNVKAAACSQRHDAPNQGRPRRTVFAARKCSTRGPSRPSRTPSSRGAPSLNLTEPRTQRLTRGRGSAMKTLLILRHAKSSWKDEEVGDHDRPLNKRGKRDAPRMGEWLAGSQPLPELIISSTAKLARKTASKLAKQCGYQGIIELQGTLYLAPPGTYLETLRQVDEAMNRVMVVGHNPGLEQLAMAAPVNTRRCPPRHSRTSNWRSPTGARSTRRHVAP